MIKGFKVLKVLVASLMLSAVMLLGACGEALSAYDIAVNNGFAGSEAEWLNSLRGQDGDNAKSIDIYDLYDAYLVENPDATFTDFLNNYLTLDYVTSQSAVNKALQSAVSIVSDFQKTVRYPNGTRTEDYQSAGAGVIYRIDNLDDAAYIITNYHVLYDSDSTTAGGGITGVAETIEVKTFGRYINGTGVSAEFIGGSVSNDIAVIKVSASQLSEFAAVRASDVGDSSRICAGEAVYAVGNPEALGISATAGIISVDSEQIRMQALDNANTYNYLRCIRVDAAINGGNSGGGLYNEQGALIGIVNAKIVDESIENIGYAIPVNIASSIADSFIDLDGKKSVIGISTQTSAVKTVYNGSYVEIIETVSIVSVEENSLASSAGFLAGDVIKRASLGDGEVTRLQISPTRSFHLSEFMLKAYPDEVLNVTVLRGGNEQILTVTLSADKRVAL